MVKHKTLRHFRDEGQLRGTTLLAQHVAEPLITVLTGGSRQWLGFALTIEACPLPGRWASSVLVLRGHIAELPPSSARFRMTYYSHQSLDI